MNQVKQAIIDFVETLQNGQSRFDLEALLVERVDEEKRIIDAKDSGGSTLHNLRLQALGGSILPIPKPGSVVLALISRPLSCGYIIRCTKLEKLQIAISDTTIEIDKDAIVIDGGNLGGLIKIEEITKRLNKIEQDINNLKTNIGNWTPVAQDGGGALKTLLESWSKKQLELSKRDQYENEKVKH